MPEADQVVSNTSPLLNLALISRLDLLAEQFETVHVPRQVWEELADGTDGMDDLRTLRSRDFLSVVPVEETDLYVEIARQLDEGETAAITAVTPER
jgi:predicted nucleic acid-binding protein